jgi:hypothetical protein
MKEQNLYTQEQLDICLLKQRNDEFSRSINRIDNHLNKIEGNQKWLLSLMGTGFVTLVGLMAHGFHWIN